MTPPRLIVGLGNPGAAYAETRHNAGAWLVQALALKQNISWAKQNKFFGQIAHDRECTLLLPETFMNRSGQSVAAFARFYKISPAEILVVHDELDIPPGSIRLKQGGSPGGHNGVKDIQSQLASADFWRLRLGIGHPRELTLAQNGADFVLHSPLPLERQAIEQAITRSLQTWPLLVKGNYPAAQQQLHSTTL